MPEIASQLQIISNRLVSIGNELGMLTAAVLVLIAVIFFQRRK